MSGSRHLPASTIEAKVRFMVSRCLGKLEGCSFSYQLYENSFGAKVVKKNAFFETFGPKSLFEIAYSYDGGCYFNLTINHPNQEKAAPSIEKTAQLLASQTGMEVPVYDLGKDQYVYVGYIKEDVLSDSEVQTYMRDVLSHLEQIARLLNPGYQY